MAKRKSQPEESESTEIALEPAMAELAQIVSRLESGQETLDESLAQFERGMALLRVCHRKLDTAAQRIELVTKLSATDEVETVEFDSTSTLQKNTAADAARASRKLAKEPVDDDGGLLF
jgi:exodeoxyribonuclease VII small subunit